MSRSHPLGSIGSAISTQIHQQKMVTLKPTETKAAKTLSVTILFFFLFNITLLSALTSIPAQAYGTPPPPLMQANIYHSGVNLADYWVSEKFDGVRGYWDGYALWTRSGNPIHAPAWFTSNWPEIPLDGELWAGRGLFTTAVSTVRQQTPNDAAWRQIRFMVFDLPAHPGTFDARIPALKSVIATMSKPWVQTVTQLKIKDEQTLRALLHKKVNQGGEGLMLHRGDATYRGIRSDDLLKLKTHTDTEAQVVDYISGKGKYLGMMGALVVETPQGLRFKIGTGFTDAERRKPPAVGSWITYRYRGLNPSGLPRFASFMRVRDEFLLIETPQVGQP